MGYHNCMAVAGSGQSASLFIESHRHQYCSPKQLSTRKLPEEQILKCLFGDRNSKKNGLRQVLSGVAASIIFLSQNNLAFAEDFNQENNMCQVANALNLPTLPLEKGADNNIGMMVMMQGMTYKNFDPVRYAGRWFEVASLKRGFAGQGQQDCHCTQGVYTFDPDKAAIQVDTFCIHGGPDGYITGIRGRVQCLSMEDTEKNVSDLEKGENIKQKCYLRFPTLPFIPKEPYDVIETDYDNFALVSGAKDTSFVQIYSRTPNPGPRFIEKYKARLESYGYNASEIVDTPQDCKAMSSSQLTAMMSMKGMQQALNNQFPDLELKGSVEFNPFTSVFDTLKKLVELYFKQLVP